MVRYETLLLAIPEITNEEASKLEAQFIKMINAIKGNLISFERWGKYRLAYPVKKNDYGVYFLTRYELPNDQKNQFFAELKDLFAIKYNDLVMRHVVTALPAGKNIEYQKPRSLEETPKDMENLQYPKAKEYSDMGSKDLDFEDKK